MFLTYDVWEVGVRGPEGIQGGGAAGNRHAEAGSTAVPGFGHRPRTGGVEVTALRPRSFLSFRTDVCLPCARLTVCPVLWWICRGNPGPRIDT